MYIDTCVRIYTYILASIHTWRDFIRKEFTKTKS